MGTWRMDKNYKQQPQVFYKEACTSEGLHFIKKRLQRRCFPVSIAKVLRTSILKNICERLILKIENINFFKD